MTTAIAVLGGGTPFTYGLADSLEAEIPAEVPLRLRLLGRTADGPATVARAIAGRWRSRPWTVEGGTSLPWAVEGAGIVVNQIRFGGSRERSRDEDVAESAGVAADETMGPAGIRAALRVHTSTTELGGRLQAYAPDAHVVTMSNPLAVSTRSLAHAHRGSVMGVCEVPALTLEHLAHTSGQEPHSLDLDYVGLNHRGFHYPRTPLPGTSWHALPWASTKVVSTLGGWPAKQFGELRREPSTSKRRASAVQAVADAALREMRASPDRPPAALKRRATPWYRLAVAPLISALSGCGPRMLVLTIMEGDLAIERVCFVDATGARPVDNTTDPPDPIKLWHEAFVRHQSLVDRAVDDPSAVTVRAALDGDPLLRVDTSAVGHLVDTLLSERAP